MSYVEHGPRIFLAGRPNTGIPLIYGDYVLPRKRLEGRLKLYDSCSDIRAWSPNSLENSRYFRELSEHESPLGKLIPFNVVVDNIIRLNSQAQNELQAIKQELQKYKSIKLTPKQKEQLQNSDCTQKITETSEKGDCTTGTLLKDTVLHISKSVPIVQSNSCLSVHMPFIQHIQNKIDESALTNHPAQLHSYSLNALYTDLSSNNYTLTSSFRPPFKAFSPVDIALQIKQEAYDGQIDNYSNKVVMSQTSFTYKSNDEDNSDIEPDKSSLLTNNHEGQSFECDASCSESTQETGTLPESGNEIETESDFDIHSNIHKGIIIQKDSEIIVLKNELCVRDAELEELRDMNKNFEILIKEKEDSISAHQENLKILHERLVKLDHQYNCEVEDLKEKLCGCKQLIGQLKQELNKECENCYLQAQKIDRLQLYVDEVKTLQLEKDTLLKKLQDMEQVAKKAENYNLVFEQLKNISQEKDQLRKQNYEQSCILADQEGEINRLLTLIAETSVTYDEQKKTKTTLENLKIEIRDKSIKISQYEEELLITKQEISDFFNNLKHTLNNLEEFNGLCEDLCNCEKCDLDIGEEANNVLCNINVIMTRFQSYKTERQNLLQQIEHLKHYVECDKQHIYENQNLRKIISESFYCESATNSSNPSEEDSVIILNIKQNKNNTNKLEVKDIPNSVNSENSLNEVTNNECCKYIIKMNKKNGMDEIEKEIIEYVSYFVNKIDSLSQKLQIYAEIERPLMIKQIYNFYEVLKDTESAINTSQDITLRKQRIFELYNHHKKEHKKYNSNVKQLPNDLSQVQIKINEFIEAIHYQLLDGILYIERKDLSDKQINHAFEIHLKSCINRINIALQGAGNQRIQIAEEIEKQQKELQKKDIEIAQLKEEMAQHLARRGEGDYLNQEKSNTNAAFKEQLLKITTELNEKDGLILKLKEEIKLIKKELFTYNEDCSALRKEIKNLDNIKNRLLKECQQSKEQLMMKNKEIKNLSEQINDLFECKNLGIIMENKIEEMEKELFHFKFNNSELKDKLAQANEIILKKNEIVINLKNTIDENENTLSYKIIEYKNAMEENHSEIIKLKNENKLLNEKLKNTENKIAEMNQTILSLTEQNDKINIIYMLQEDLTKLDKNERKLKIELNNLKAELANDQSNNKKLDNNLDMFLCENENLKRSVEYWKTENSKLSVKLYNEMIEEKLKNNLYTVSNRIHEKLSTLKNQFNLEEHLSNNQLNETLQNKYIMYKDKKMEPGKDESEVQQSEYSYEQMEVKENEVEEIQKQQLLNSTKIRDEIFKNDYTTYDQLNSSENSNLRTGYKTNKENEDRTKKLLQDIEIRDSEIRSLKEAISGLAQENAHLHTIRKSQIEEYQDKLTLMKKNYDSSLNALCERHNESVDILQRRFEDIMKDERTFDSENWLQTLNINELTELYERISMIIDNNTNLIQMKNKNQYFYENDIRKEMYTKVNKTCENIQESHKNIRGNEQLPSKVSPSIITQEANLDLQNQWQFTILRQTQYPIMQMQDYKPNLGQNFGNERKSSELENKYEIEKEVVRDNTFDQQRWNFINQCSAYHKLSNNYVYPK